jgi:hypothetical protein
MMAYRYFIVFFQGYIEGPVAGHVSVRTQRVFLNAKRTYNLIREQYPDTRSQIITGILKVTKEEYEEWMRGDDSGSQEEA